MSVLTTNTTIQSITKESWPILYRDVLEIGNLKSNVGICTLWTHRKSAKLKFDPRGYTVMGNLYSTEGIPPMIRNIYANPRIRHLVLWGNDLSDSGDALVEFMREGLDDRHRTRSGKVQIEPEIDIDAINRLRAKVSLIDLRGESVERARDVIRDLPSLPPFCEPVYFPEAKDPSPEGDPEGCPSEWSGFRASGESVAQTWLQILYLVMRFGHVKRTKYGNTNELREALNLVAVVTEEDPDQEYLPSYLPVTRAQLQEYYPQVLESQYLEGTSYTYGNRLRDYDGIDQIHALMERVKQSPSSKRMFATTWKVSIDIEGGDAPCLTQINGSVQDGRFLLTAHFRSQDMFGAWPVNAFSMRKLQSHIAEAAGLPLGPLTMVTHSAHIYAWDWSKARRLIEEYKRARNPASEMDPRGYVVVSVTGSEIEARLYSYETNLLDKVSGRNAYKVGLEIVRRMWTADAGHSLYLGRELMKAEVALRTGGIYLQDSELEIDRIDGAITGNGKIGKV